MRPPWLVEDRYEWLWLYAAVEPVRGDSFFLLMPHVDSQCLGLFLKEFGDHVSGKATGLVLDGSGSHQAGSVKWPENVVRVPLPPYSPELNPAEAVFRELRAKLANWVFADLAELEEAISEDLRPFWEEPVRLQTLTGYPWWLDGARMITNKAA